MSITIKDLLGREPEFSPKEIRLHTLSLSTSVLILTLSIPVFLLNLFEIGVLMISLGLTWASAFVISRYLSNYSIALAIIALSSLGGLIFAYIAKGGIDGPSLTFILMSFTLFMALLESKYHKWNYLGHLLLSTGLMVWNYNTNQSFTQVYESEFFKYIDYYISILFGITAVFFLYRYTIRAWEKKNRELEKQNEINIELRKTLEELNSEKDRLFSILAHDVRSPLASIEGVMEIFGRGGLTNEEQKVLSEELLTMTRGSIFLVENLLYWAKHELGSDKPQDLFHLDDVMEQIELMFTPIAKKKEVHLSFEITPGLAITSHRNGTEVLLRNIIHNAIKFSPRGGRVGVRTSKNSNCWDIFIEDDGNGLDPDFFQKMNSTKSTLGTVGEPGTGLGLWLVKLLAERLGYEIEIQRPALTGTRFRVSIPR